MCNNTLMTFAKHCLNALTSLKLEAKFVFESNLADWLAALVLPHQN